MQKSRCIIVSATGGLVHVRHCVDGKLDLIRNNVAMAGAFE